MSRELLQQALDALKSCSGVPHWPALQPVIDDIRAELAKPELPWGTDPLLKACVAQPERPSHTEAGLNEAHTTGVVIFPNDQFREAFRGLIDAGDKP